MTSKDEELILEKNNTLKEVLVFLLLGFCFSMIAPLVYWEELDSTGNLTFSLILGFVLFLSIIFPFISKRVIGGAVVVIIYLSSTFSIFLITKIQYQLDTLYIVGIIIAILIIGFVGINTEASLNIFRIRKKHFRKSIKNHMLPEDKIATYESKNEGKKLTKSMYGRYIGYAFFIGVFLLTGGSKYGGGSVLNSILPDGGSTFMMLGALVALNISIWSPAIVGYYISQKAFNELRKEYAENQHFHFSNKPN